MSQTGKKNLVITSIALYFTYFIHGIGASIMGQYKPELAAHWGAKALSDGTMDVSMVVSVIAALGLGRLISLPFSGPLSDKFGRRLSGIIGVICYFGCLILHIPDTILVAVIIGVTNVIPVFGPFIGAIPTLLLVVIQSPLHALYLLIFIIILQQVDGNIIGPKILGDSTGLSAFWVMFSILIGGGLFGFLGMLLGVPVFAMIYYIIRRLVNHSIRKKNLTTVTEAYVEAAGVDEATSAIIYYGEKQKKKRTLKDSGKKDETKKNQ